MESATSEFKMTVCTELQMRPEIHIMMGA